MKKNVHVIFKTHLDIGFTDFSSEVTELYLNEYIPKALNNTKVLNKDGKKFIWTVGSWLIEEALKHYKGQDLKEFTDALKNGDIRWHGLPFTTHSELLSEELVKHCLEKSKKLDAMFAKNTISAKMTDVPGHTISLVKHFSNYGIKFLHIGVNPASKVPAVPQIFNWQDQNGKSIIVAYAGTYGQDLEIDNFDEILVFAHSDDNNGPQTIEEVEEIFINLNKKYPDCNVFASTLDAYAEKLIKADIKLPVIEKEIGDSWIHGVGSDPWKVSQYRRILKKVTENYSSFSKSEIDEIYDNLALVCEHTWGMDTKLYLANYMDYDFESFNKQLSNKALFNKRTKYHDFIKSYSLNENQEQQIIDQNPKNIEDSWVEQRTYINNALKILHAKGIEVVYPEVNFNGKIAGMQDLRIADSKIEIIDNKINLFKDEKSIIKNLHVEIIQNGKFFYDNWFNKYVINLTENKSWAVADQGKPGLNINNNANFDQRILNYEIAQVKINDAEIVFKYVLIEELDTFKAPNSFLLSASFEKNKWSFRVLIDKLEKNRWPMEINLKAQASSEFAKAQKINNFVNLNEVIENGGNNLSCIEKAIFEDFSIENIDSPLFSLSDSFKSLDLNPTLSKNQLTFNIYNNSWGTNFPMWYGDDIFSEFIIKLN